jgi:hypothetical protein
MVILTVTTRVKQTSDKKSSNQPMEKKVEHTSYYQTEFHDPITGLVTLEKILFFI